MTTLPPCPPAVSSARKMPTPGPTTAVPATTSRPSGRSATAAAAEASLDDHARAPDHPGPGGRQLHHGGAPARVDARDDDAVAGDQHRPAAGAAYGSYARRDVQREEVVRQVGDPVAAAERGVERARGGELGQHRVVVEVRAAAREGVRAAALRRDRDRLEAHARDRHLAAIGGIERSGGSCRRRGHDGEREPEGGEGDPQAHRATLRAAPARRGRPQGWGSPTLDNPGPCLSVPTSSPPANWPPSWRPTGLRRPYVAYRADTGELVLRGLVTDSITVGRADENDIALAWDAEVSRAHARLERVAGRWTVVDDGLSRNGTFVGGERIRGRRALDPGALVRVGRTTLVLRGGAHNAVGTATAAGRRGGLPGHGGRAPRAGRALPPGDRWWPRHARVQPGDRRRARAQRRRRQDPPAGAVRQARRRRPAAQNRKRAELARRALAIGLVGPADYE